MTPPRKRAGGATGARRIDGELLDVAGAAALLGVTEKAIRARVERRLLPFRRWGGGPRRGGRLIFERAALLEFIAGLPGCSVGEALSNRAQRAGERPA
jgi:hypothetical protein